MPGYRRKLAFGGINGGKNYVEDVFARNEWGRWNASRTAKVHSFGQVTFSDVTDPVRLLALTRVALAEAARPKVSYEVDAAALDGGDAALGDTVAVIDRSRDPEWRLRARVVRRVREFGETVVARVTIGTVQPVDYASVSSLAADVATLRDDVTGLKQAYPPGLFIRGDYWQHGYLINHSVASGGLLYHLEELARRWA